MSNETVEILALRLKGDLMSLRSTFVTWSGTHYTTWKLLTAFAAFPLESQCIHSFIRLNFRVDELEEEVRELQVQSREMLEEERKRSREIAQRIEREKQLEIENYAIKLQTLERDHQNLLQEAHSLKSALEKTKEEKICAEESLAEFERNFESLRSESQRDRDTFKRESAEREEVISALKNEVESLRSELIAEKTRSRPATSPLMTLSSVDESNAAKDAETLKLRLEELESDLQVSRKEEQRLREQNEELVLQYQVDQGKRLVSNSQSLKLEMDSMTDLEVRAYFYFRTYFLLLFLSLRVHKPPNVCTYFFATLLCCNFFVHRCTNSLPIVSLHPT